MFDGAFKRTCISFNIVKRKHFIQFEIIKHSNSMKWWYRAHIYNHHPRVNFFHIEIYCNCTYFFSSFFSQFFLYFFFRPKIVFEFTLTLQTKYIPHSLVLLHHPRRTTTMRNVKTFAVNSIAFSLHWWQK